MAQVRFAPLDEAAFRRMLPVYFQELYLSSGDTPPTAQQMAETLDIILELHSQHRLQIVMCHVDGQAAGFCIYELGTRGRPEQGFIAEFYIAPPYRRGGIGRTMAELVINEFQRYGARGVWLTTDTADTFWRSCGFAPTGEISRENDCPIYELSLAEK